MRQPSITQAIARRVMLLLLCTSLLQVIVTIWLVNRESVVLREQLMTFGLRLLRIASLGGEGLSERRLVSEFGDLGGIAIVLYDGQGRILARSRRDVALPRLLSEKVRRAARLQPRRPLWLEPYTLLRDNVAIQFVPGGRGARYVGIVDRWAPTRVDSALLWGLGLGLLSVVIIGVAAIQLMTRRVRRNLARSEQVIQQMAGGDLSVRLAENRSDEFGRLARSFNQMADILAENMRRIEATETRRRRAFADWTHEMATPLSSVLGYLESLQHQEHDAETRRKYVENAYNGAVALRRLNDDLTTLSQIEFEGHCLDFGPVDLVEIIRQERDVIAPQARSRNVTVDLALDAERAEIVADEGRLAQVIRNLLSNAVRHTPAGRAVTVRLSTGDPDQVEIAVVDQGEGISVEHLGQVGQPFYRVDSSRSRSTGGRGLGLAIVKSLVMAHGGVVHIESSEGRGTTVRVSLPRLDQGGQPDSE